MSGETSNRDWHEYKCGNDHIWWSAPTSNRCPVCGTATYQPYSVHHGTIAVVLSEVPCRWPITECTCDECG